MDLDRMTDAQRTLVDDWMPGAVIVADLSWNLMDTVVLRVRHDGQDRIVKAAGEGDHHLGSELDAHEGDFTAPWTRTGHAGRLRHADRDARVLVVDFLPGDLAYRTAAATDPEVHRRAGELLRRSARRRSSTATAVTRGIRRTGR